MRTNINTGKRRILSFSVSNVLAGEENLDLQSEDKIVIYAAEQFKDEEQVTIQGAIRKPGQYPLREAMTLADLIVEARGLRDNAYRSRAEVARLDPQQAEQVALQTLFVPLDEATDKFVLEDNDVVFIRETPGVQAQQSVTVTGEVKFPGAYSLTGDNGQLSQLIARVGGLTEHAFLEGCHFTRERNGERKRVAVDLEKGLSGDEEQDLILMDGDEIHIPPRDWVVSVEGAVHLPQLVQYVPNKKAQYYIDVVGGLQPKADSHAAYIVRANQLILKATNRFWFDPPVPPGSTLVIPSQEGAAEDFISGLAVAD